jgi:hypothetical protein
LKLTKQYIYRRLIIFTCIVKEYETRRDKYLVGNQTFNQKYEEYRAGNTTEEDDLNAVPMKKSEFDDLREELDVFRIKFNQSMPMFFGRGVKSRETSASISHLRSSIP